VEEKDILYPDSVPSRKYFLRKTGNMKGTFLIVFPSPIPIIRRDNRHPYGLDDNSLSTAPIAEI
jgi:hypothetical protein